MATLEKVNGRFEISIIEKALIIHFERVRETRSLQLTTSLNLKALNQTFLMNCRFIPRFVNIYFRA